MKMYTIERYYLNRNLYKKKGWYEAYCEDTFIPDQIYRSFNKKDAMKEFKEFYLNDEMAPNGEIYHYSLEENDSKKQEVEIIEESEPIK